MARILGWVSGKVGVVVGEWESGYRRYMGRMVVKKGSVKVRKVGG